MNVNDYAEQVVTNFIRDITDHVFLSIERDDRLMREHMSNIGNHGRTAVDTTIGKKVRELLNLQNDGENKEPKSRLIESYTYHKIG